MLQRQKQAFWHYMKPTGVATHSITCALLHFRVSKASDKKHSYILVLKLFPSMYIKKSDIKDSGSRNYVFFILIFSWKSLTKNIS